MFAVCTKRKNKCLCVNHTLNIGNSWKGEYRWTVMIRGFRMLFIKWHHWVVVCCLTHIALALWVCMAWCHGDWWGGNLCGFPCNGYYLTSFLCHRNRFIYTPILDSLLSTPSHPALIKEGGYYAKPHGVSFYVAIAALLPQGCDLRWLQYKAFWVLKTSLKMESLWWFVFMQI